MALLLNEKYFNDKEFKSVSGAGLKDFMLMNPEAEGITWRKAQELKGLPIKSGEFESVDDATLINMMRKQIYANNLELREKLIQSGGTLVPVILDKYLRSMNEFFIDHVFWFLTKLNYDCEDYLLDNLEEFRSPYTQSTACQVLGMIGSKKSVEVLDNKYELYKKAYPGETYEQAALYGLWHLGRRLGHHNVEYEVLDR